MGAHPHQFTEAIIFSATFYSCADKPSCENPFRILHMNKNILLITVALALSLSGVGCNKSGKLDKASTFTPPSGPVELKLKWPVGERIVQSFDMKQNMEIFVPNQPDSIKQNMTMGQEYGLTVLKEDAGRRTRGGDGIPQ